MSNPVDVQSLRELRDGQRGIEWLQALARANVRRSQGPASERAYALASEIDRLDEDIQSTYTDDKYFFKLPKAWWAWVPLLYSGGFLYSSQTEFFEDRMNRWMWFLVGFGVFAVFFLLRKAWMENTRKIDKTKARPRLKGQRAALMVELLQVRDTLVGEVSKVASDSIDS
tara:strand:- start:256 stop:765 length:510 start_codon:yes stop_codon:yes gene_type:complete